MSTSTETRRDYQRNYKLKNLEKIKQVNRLYYQRNRERLVAEQKLYRDTHKDIRKVTQATYYLKNKDKIKANQSDYYRKNIKEITLRRDTKVKCECGRTVSHSGLSAHQKTLIHLENIDKPYTIDRIDFLTHLRNNNF